MSSMNVSGLLRLTELLCSDIANRLAMVKDGATITRREVELLTNAYNAIAEQDTTESEELSAALTECEDLVHRLSSHTTTDGETGDVGPTLDVKHSGKQWVLFNVSRRRRLQTFVITLCLFFTGLPIWVGIYLFILFKTPLWPLAIAYAIVIFVQRNDRHPLPQSHWFRSWTIWRYYVDYFPVRVAITNEAQAVIKPTGNYLFCYHPHGVHAFGAICVFGYDVLGLDKMLPGLKIYLQTLRANFLIPIWRETVRWAGVGDASREAITNTLRAGPGYSVALVVGGAEESLLSRPFTNNLLLKKRKGFVRLSLMTGAPIVPVYGFGENNVYQSLIEDRPKLERILFRLQKMLGVAFPLVRGRCWFNYGFGILPYRCPIVVVIGEPVVVPHIENPTSYEIDYWHRIYSKSLLKLYREYQPLYDQGIKSGLCIVK